MGQNQIKEVQLQKQVGISVNLDDTAQIENIANNGLGDVNQITFQMNFSNLDALKNFKIDDQQLQLIATAIHNSKNITRLNLHFLGFYSLEQNFGIDALSSLQKAITNNQNLTHLKVTDFGSSNTGFQEYTKQGRAEFKIKIRQMKRLVKHNL
ncbi:hypothetical protein ABPG74_007025 [Tetrahymena malaccensis]